MSTSFINEDNQMITIVMNDADESVDYKFFVGQRQAKVTIPARAMQTIVY
tara:strand:- start:1355 stop:1504 length:150 start_codon:yes stop_codon:yes gene_type:complete